MIYPLNTVKIHSNVVTMLVYQRHSWAVWKATKRPKWCNSSDPTLIRGVTLNAARWIVEIDSSARAGCVSPNGGYQKWMKQKDLVIGKMNEHDYDALIFCVPNLKTTP